jgi:hypothetical protein
MSGDFERGFAYDCEWAITATDDLLEPAALLSALLTPRGHDQAAADLDHRVTTSMRRLRSWR